MSESPEYVLGQVAAHAYNAEFQELAEGYEKLAGGTGLLPSKLLEGAAQAGQLAKKTTSAVPSAAGDALSQAGKYVAPVARKARFITPKV